jgi:hypothetical protein
MITVTRKLSVSLRFVARFNEAVVFLSVYIALLPGRSGARRSIAIANCYTHMFPVSYYGLWRKNDMTQTTQLMHWFDLVSTQLLGFG